MANKTKTKTESEYLQEVSDCMQLLKQNTAARRDKSGRAEHARRLNRDPDILRKRSKTMKILWSNPTFRKKQSEGMKAHYRENPERKEELSKIRAEVMKALWNNPKYRKKQSERMKAFWVIPENKKMISEAMTAAWIRRKLEKLAS